jgi:hypothetical protein
VKRAAIRWARRLLGLGAGLAVLAAVVHLPQVRALVLARVMARLNSGPAFVYSAKALDYNVFRLTVGVEDFQIVRRGSPAPPVLRVERVTAVLSPAVFSGAIALDRLEADGLTLVIDLADHGGRPARDAAPFTVPAFSVGHASVRHASVEVLDPGGLGRLRARDVALDAEGSGPRQLSAAFVAAGGVTLDGEHTRVAIDRVEGRAFLDGNTIGVSPAAALAGGARVVFDGPITFTGPSPRFDLGVDGSLDAGQVAAWFPDLPGGRGPLSIKGRVSGPLNDPRFKYALLADRLTLPDINLPAASAEGLISRDGILIDRLRTVVGRGWVEAGGRLPLGRGEPDTRVKLNWADVPVAALAKVFAQLPSDPVGLVTTGSARLSWPGAALDPAALSGEADAAVRFAPALPAARVRAAAKPGRWSIRAEQALEGDTLAALDAELTVDAAAFAASAIEGTLRATSADAVQALSELRRGIPSLPDVSARLAASPIALDARIGGTIGSPRLVGSTVSDRLRVEGLPPMHATAEFEATTAGLALTRVSAEDGTGNRVDGRATFDVDAATTSGAVTADIPDIEPIMRAWLDAGRTGEQALKAGGSARIAAEWSGALQNPAVAMTVGGTNLALDTGSFGVTGA